VLAVGDRVRLAKGSRAPLGRAGDIGTVFWISYQWPAGEVLFYFVRLDDSGKLTMLYPHEVEPLGGP